MKLTKKKAKQVLDAVEIWKEEGVITVKKAEELGKAVEVVPFDWQRLAKYSFWAALACILISVISIFADKVILEMIKKFFSAPIFVKMLFFGACAVGFYYFGYRRKISKPNLIFSTEAIFFLGVVFTATSIMYLGKLIGSNSGHFSILILLSCIVYVIVAYLTNSKLILVFALFSFGGWFGAETGYISGWGAYFLGMSYPLRFALLGFILAVMGHNLLTYKKTKEFAGTILIFGLLYLFIALWLLSIFGNYGERAWMYRTEKLELFGWSLLFALASFGAIFYGLKYDIRSARGFGITFLFINLYTKFFEYFWNATHKAIFFAILGASLWYIGSKAEKIWNIGNDRKKS